MIYLRQWTLLERLMRWLSPAYRARQDAATREAIRRLVDDPSEACMIGDRLIPNGYGIDQEQRR
jgi:hypothetical protein